MNCLMTAWHANEVELRGWLRHRLGNPVDTEDMLQDLFIKARRQGERFCAIDNARAWLFEVARNAVADRLRLRRGRRARGDADHDGAPNRMDRPPNNP